MKDFWQKLPQPFFCLAPMEDVTDTVFRQVVASLAKPEVFFTEFTNCDGLASVGREKVIDRLQFTESEKPIIAQIWGSKPENFYQAAKEITKMGFTGIDINMGCPRKAVIKHGTGGALIKNPSKALEMILAVRQGAPNLPLSVKTRIGWNSIQTTEWLGFLLEQDLAALTVHGRIVKDQFEVPANWEEIGKVVKLKDQMGKDTVIIGNGDVMSYQEGLEKVKKYGVDGVMIGRGVFHNPFIFDPRGRTLKNVEERLDLLLRHTELFVKTWGARKNFSILKKFFKIYISDFPGASKLRSKLMEVNSLEEVEEIIEDFRLDQRAGS